MKYIVGFIVLILSLSMFFIDRKRKFQLILISCVCLNFASFPLVSFGSANQMLCLFFFLSEIRNLKVFLHRLKKTPIYLALLIVTLSTIITIIMSPHAHNIVTIIGLIIGDLLTKYYVIAYAFLMFTDSWFRLMSRTLYVCLLVLTFFGILNLLTKDSIVLTMMGNTFGEKIASLDRMRVVALFNYPFDYGYMCVMSLLITIYNQKRKLLTNNAILISYICSGIGIVICGCRTIFVLAGICLLLYYMINYSVFKALRAISICVIMGIGAYFMIPSVKDKVDTTLTAFTFEETEEDSGSSLVGRILQYDTAINYIQEHKIFGRGYRFFQKDLGYDKNGNGMFDLPTEARPLLGLEGAIMKLILENGYFGVICYLLFYIIMIRYSLKLCRYSKLDGSMAAIILTAYLLYGNMTGELSSSIITFILSGIFLKKSDICRIEYLKRCRNLEEHQSSNGSLQIA